MNNRLGFFYAILSWSLFVVYDVFVKLLSEIGAGAIETVWFYAIGTVAIAGAFMRKKNWLELFGFVKNKTKLAIPMGLLSIGASAFSCKAFALLPIPEVYVFIFLSPIVTFCMARLVLAEHIPLKRWVAVFVGLTGIVFAYWGDMNLAGNSLDTIGLLACAGTIVCLALNVVLLRYVQLSAQSMSLWPALFGLVICPLIMPQSFAEVAAHVTEGGWHVAGVMVFSAVAMILRCESCRVAPASVCAVSHYFQMPVGIFMGWLVWDRFASPAMLAGGVIVVASGLFLLLSQRRDTPVLPEAAARLPVIKN